MAEKKQKLQTLKFSVSCNNHYFAYSSPIGMMSSCNLCCGLMKINEFVFVVSFYARNPQSFGNIALIKLLLML